MHRVIREYRRILPNELPQVRDSESGELRAATQQELLNMGIVCVNDVEHLYSCVRQETGDLARDASGQLTRVWRCADGDRVAACGKALCAGDVAERHRRLPSDVRKHVMRARVFTGKATIEASIAEQQAALDTFVGAIEGRALVDLATPEAKLAEARRLAAIESVVEVQPALVPMSQVDQIEHVVEQTDVIPHAWAGELG